MGKLKNTIQKLIPGSSQKYFKPKEEVEGIEGNTLVPVKGLGRAYVANKKALKEWKPSSTKNLDTSKWGGEVPMPMPKKTAPTKAKPVKFKMSKKGVLSKIK